MISKQFEVFLEVARSGSFTKAAEKMYVTPVSVMKRINELEDQLGVRLFVRTRRGVRLTAVGKELYEDTLQIARDSERAVARAMKQTSPGSCVFRVGSSMLNPCRIFLDTWQRIVRRHPEYSMKIVPFLDDPKSIEEMLDRLGSEIDFLIGTRRSGIWYERCRFFPLGEYPMYCAVSCDNPLSSRASLRISDLYGQEIIVSRMGDMERVYDIFSVLAERHPMIRVIPTPSFDLATINKCAENGRILLTAGGWAGEHPSMVTLPVEWDLVTQYGILYAHDCSPEMERFIRLLEEELEMQRK